MDDPRDPVPPGHGEPRNVGAIPEELPLPRIAPPIAFQPVCAKCWYQHEPDEECPK